MKQMLPRHPVHNIFTRTFSFPLMFVLNSRNAPSDLIGICVSEVKAILIRTYRFFLMTARTLLH